MTALFDTGARTDKAPGGQGEPIYSVLNRRAGDRWHQVRCLVQEWFDAVPVDVKGRKDLGRRLTSTKNSLFRGAFLELYCHQLLLRSGYQVEHHPIIEGTAKHPDFAASRPGGQLYLEATVMTPSPATKGEQTRTAELVDRINNRLSTAAFSLNLIVEQVGERSAPTREICMDIKQHLDHLDPERFDPGDPDASWEWSNEDWVLEVSANLLDREHWHDGLRIIGAHGPGIHVLEDVNPTAVLLKKVGRYGQTRLGRPYLIGADVQGYPDDQDIINALYGKLRLDSTTDPASPTWRRIPDGVWRNEHGWINPHLSAVVTVADLYPWTIAATVPAVWLHPEPTHPIETPFTVARYSRLNQATGTIEWSPATTEPAEFFGLERGWPG